MVSNIDQLVGCYSFTCKCKSYYGFICTDSHQYLHSLLHVTHQCIKGTQSSQDFCLNRICSDPIFLIEYEMILKTG